MKKRTTFRILAVMALAILPLLAAAPASAGGSTHSQFILPYDYSYTLYAGDENNPCQDFDIYFQREGSLRINFWQDEYGRGIKGIDIWGTMTRTATVGEKTVEFLVQGPVRYDFTYFPDNIVEMRIQSMGTAVLLTVPGYGKIMGGGGLLIETVRFVIDEYGNWTEVEGSYSVKKDVGNYNDDWAAFCEYMAP